jgi:outer membrane protein OmpA-like peptidoglycan-associated protein
MKAFPDVTVKFGGYTDNTGNADHNKQLSGERATSAMNQVAALGIDPSRMSAAGFGDQHPVADNSTAEGRQHNRRVDINVTKK